MEKGVLKEAVFSVVIVAVVVSALVVAGWFQRDGDNPHGIGAGDNKFWTTYPDSHQRSGQPVCHPQWVLDALDDGVVMILSHSELCLPCKNMVVHCGNINSDHEDSMTYFDLIHTVDEPRASDALSVYDPSGEPNYVPLTVILTRFEGADGEVSIAWHSWEGEVAEDTLDNWVEKAIHYFEDVRAR